MILCQWKVERGALTKKNLVPVRVAWMRNFKIDAISDLKKINQGCVTSVGR